MSKQKQQTERPALPPAESNGGPPASPARQARDQHDLMSFGGGGQRLSTSLNVDDPAMARRFLSAQQDCDRRLVECVNQQIAVTDYVVHDVELKNRETGEVIPSVRLVLIDKDGLTYEAVSETLLRSFQRIAFLFGKPPWNPSRVLVPMTKKKGEYSIYWFDVA